MSLGLIGVFILLYLLLLGVRPLVIPDETRYGEVPKEMLASGDWVVPHLNGIRYFEKPVLGYWLNAVAMRLLGANAFAIRLPSAVAVGLTALLLFVWARRFSDDATPLFATAVFLLSFEVLAIGTFCVLDSLLSLFVTAAIVAFDFALRQASRRTGTILLLLAGAACGLAFLTKGFLALVIPVLVIVPFSLWQGQFKTLLRTAWVAGITAVLVVLPWAVMIHRREPDFWHYFFWVEHVNRFISPHGGQHPEPFWFYLPILFGGAMPWTPLVGPIVVGLRHANWKHPMLRLALCWLVLPFLFFSACSGKLGTYILPCFPPLAFLIAIGVLRCLREGDAKGFVIGAWLVLCATGLLLVALIVGLIVVQQLSESVALWKWAIAAAGLFLWGALCWAAISRKEIKKRLLLYCAAPVLFTFSWPLITPAALKARKAPGAFLLSNANRISPNNILVAENGLTAAACWYYGRDNVCILGSSGEHAYGLSYADSRHRSFDIEQLKNMIAEQDRTECVVVITKARHYGEYREHLPSPSREEIHDGLVWTEYAPTSKSSDGRKWRRTGFADALSEWHCG
jgi:4-amino-4-deoxy-L-arabinose transferase